MARAKRSVKPVVPGARVGTKNRDMRWQVGDTIWASKYEYRVYAGVSAQLGAERVAKCDEKDRMDYSSVVKNAECEECNSREVVQRRHFTPDLFVVSAQGSGRRADGQSGYFVESKGYLRGHQRALLRAFVKCNPDVDLRFIIEKDFRVTPNLTLGQWIDKFLKKPWCVWNGKLPDDWT